MPNVVQGITIKEVEDLFRAADDNAGHHVLWLDVNGDVHLDCLVDEGPVAFESRMAPNMKVRFETYDQGNDYVGPDAAADAKGMQFAKQQLERAWAHGASYVDYPITIP